VPMPPTIITDAEITAQASPEQTVYPEFIRLPKIGTHCRYTGLSRSGMAEICVPCPRNDFRPAVPSKLLRRQGAARGTRLIPYAALRAYLNSLPSQ
jgi:hypothetical protein